MAELSRGKKAAITRLHNMGLKPSEIAKRLGLDVDVVRAYLRSKGKESAGSRSKAMGDFKSVKVGKRRAIISCPAGTSIKVTPTSHGNVVVSCQKPE